MKAKYTKTILITLVLTTLIIIGFNKMTDNSAEGIKGKKISKEDYYDQIIEIGNEDIEEYLMVLTDEWKMYTESKYVPDITNTFTEVQNTTVTVPVTDNIGKIMDYLNPYKVSYKTVTTKGWSMNYGVTQINLKLLPLAKYYYDDFELNEEAQIRFLEKYLKVKKSKGRTLQEALTSYLNGED